MEAIYSIWNYKHNFKHKGLNITLQGDSRSARHSGFWINEWNIMLDAGIQSPFNIEHLFISHTHSDHINQIYPLIKGITTTPNIYIPYGTKEYVENFILSMRRLSSLTPDVKYLGCKLIEVKPGDILDLTFRKKKFQVKVFHTDHTINSVGYAFSEYRNKLKPEYNKLSKEKLKKLYRTGTNVSKETPTELLIYTGDTRGSIFETEDKIKWNNYKIILTECTFIDDLSPDINIPEMAEEKGHHYLNSLEQIATKYPHPLFILCHWSMRYKKKDIAKYFIDKKYKNIIPWLNVVNFQETDSNSLQCT